MAGTGASAPAVGALANALGNATKHHKLILPPLPDSYVYAPWTAQQTFVFVGSLTNGVNSTFFSIRVLCGDGLRPTITGGWAKLAIIDRPQEVGFVVPQGYDPITMDVPISFEALAKQPPHKFALTPDLEGDIQKLQWMAGRGKLYASKADHGVGKAATGDPPVVTVASYDGNHNQTDLVPRNCQGIRWLISNIAEDTSPSGSVGDRSGSRVRQDMVVSLTEHTAAPSSTFDSPSTRARGRNSKVVGFQTVYSSAREPTIRDLVIAHTNIRSDAAFRAVVAFNRQHGLKVSSYTQKLKAHTKVLIPTNIPI